MSKKLFALASITALTGAVATSGATAGCTTTEIVTIPAEAGTTPKPRGDAGPKGSIGEVPGDDDDDDDDAPVKTCLNEEPIDQTQYAYEKAKAVAPKGTCSTEMLTKLGAYYKEHVQDADFTVTAWAESVQDAKCAACIFTPTSEAEPAKEWGPIIVKDDKVEEINRGGCIEIASGKESCGRAYHQLDNCTIFACLKDCKTTEDFQKCRGDQKVATTACKGALAAVQKECGSNISQYLSTCKNTTYTFEAPIKAACIAGPKAGGPTDGGTKDAGDGG